MSDKPVRILLVEDDPDYAEIVRLCLGESDSMDLSYEIDVATRLAEALQKLSVSSYDAALVDLGLPDAAGMDSVTAVLAAAPTMPLLVSTNLGDEKAALEAMRLGAQDFMIKASSDSRLLKRSIRYAIERKTVQAQRDEIIRAAADGMVVVDGGGIVRFLNAAAETALGRKHMLGKPFPHRAKPGEAVMLELERPDGGKASVEMRVTEVTWNGARASLASLRDVTELRRVDQLKAEVEERRRRDELKDKWIGTMSHELRTPLTIIKGAVADLHEGLAEPLKPQQAMLVGLAHRQIERVVRMVNNLLDLSRLEAGVKAELAPVDAAEVVRRVVSDFSRAASERALKLEAEVPETGQSCSADPDMLEQLIVNLLHNALRFARSKVVVRTACRDGVLELEVRDDGVGIPAEKRDLLFTRFKQLERRKGDDYKGTGLGLSICKEITALHGGTIEASSETGKGTSFLVRLPSDGKKLVPPPVAAGEAAGSDT
jgi:signal transduction histidine kinase